jgi:hypothetical protein
MSQQNTYTPPLAEGQGYRNLTQAELKILQNQGCVAEDWNLVEVADGFDSARVKNTRFLGRVRIGRFTDNIKPAEGFEKPSGIYNATIADCTVGDNTRISNIGVHIANYDIASDVCIEDVATMATCPGATFGNGVEVVALNEAGGREVVIFDELSVQFAYLMCLHRYRPVLIKNLCEIARSYVETIRCDRGKVGQGARIFSTREILDLNVGPHAVINTAASLVNGTILSSAEAPTLVGSNVVAEDFIIAEGTSVTGTVNLKKVYIGQGCRIGNQFSAENSLFFANCEAFLGEACSVFAGPYTVSHHKSTLLIACLLSFYNAGSGTNQSNHMYKLGPIHEGKLERGTKAGSFSYMIWPCRVGPFSVILGKHTRSFDTSDFPFTHLEADANGKCSMIPGLYLTTVGTVRDSAKWPNRDRRKGANKRDIISFDVFSPYTVGKMIKACSILKNLQENTDRSVEEVAINGVRMKRVLLRTSQKLYRTGIEMYLLEKILTKAEKYIDGGIEKIRKAFAAPADGAVYSCDWVDIGGQLMPKQRLLDLTAAIEGGKIADFKAFNAEMDKIHQAAEEDQWLWVKNIYKEAFNRDLEKLTKAEFIGDIEAYQKVKTKFLRLVLVDAEKEFSEVSRTGFGQDGSAEDLSEDFRQVRGQYDQNEFVRDIHDDIKETERRVKRLKEKL